MHHPMTDRPLARSLMTLGAGVLFFASLCAAPAFSSERSGIGPDDEPREVSERERRRQRALRRLGVNEPNLRRRAESADMDALPEVDPGLVESYERVLRYIADPEREGRAPGGDGIEDAADFLVNEFRAIGLDPAFEGGASYRQEIEFGATIEAAAEALSINGMDMVAGEDFAPLAYSGSTDAQGPVVFAGFAIRSGPDGYEGIPDDADLNGAIALCLKYEPMDAEGRSLWRDEGWSNRSRMTYKVNALANRDASGVLIVSPRRADDALAGVLDNLGSTAPPQFAGARRGPSFDIPVMSVSPETAQTILLAGGSDDTLDELVTRASGRGVVEPLGARASMRVELERTPTLTDNLGALLRGRGALADEYIVIGAHYDHVGYGRFGSRMRNAAGIVHPGADDNASGTAGLLIAARQLRDRYALLGENDAARSVLFLLFTAEESGLNGSRFYVDNPIAPIESHEVMLNLDMIGTLESDPLEVGGLSSSDELGSIALAHLDASGLVYAEDVSVGSGRSDHASFDAERVPNLFLFTGLHERYHLPGDTIEFVDTRGAVRVATICAQIAYDAATDPGVFVHTRDTDGADEGPRREPKVRVGIVPSNAFGGGMTVLRVFDETSASQAGLEPQDKITHWNGEPIGSVEDWLPVLSAHEPGDVVVLRVERAGREIELEMTLRSAD